MGLLDGLFGGKRVAPITTSAPNMESQEIAALRAKIAELPQETSRLEHAIQNDHPTTAPSPGSEIDATSFTVSSEDVCDQSGLSEGIDDPLEVGPETSKHTFVNPSELESVRLMLEQTKRAEALARVGIAIRRLLIDRLSAELLESKCEISRLCDDQLAQLTKHDAWAREEREKSDSLLLQASLDKQGLEAELSAAREELARAFEANARAKDTLSEMDVLKDHLRDLEEERTRVEPLHMLLKELRARVDAAEIENAHLRRGQSREVSDIRKEVVSLRMKAIELKAMTEKSRNSFDTISRLESRLERHQQESSRLATELDVAQQSIARYRSTVATQLADKRQLMRELDAANASLSSKQKVRQALANQAAVTKGALTDQQDKLLKLSSRPEWFDSKNSSVDFFGDASN